MPSAIKALPAIAGGLTAAKVAKGTAIAGAATNLAGRVTGSRTLQRLGAGAMLAGGVGMGLTGLMEGSPGAMATGVATGMGATEHETARRGISTEAGRDRLFAGSASAEIPIPTNEEVGGSILDRASDVLTRFDRAASILGGMGLGYVMHQTEQLRQEIPRRQYELDRERWAQMQINRGAMVTPSNLQDLPALGGGLLRVQQP